MNPCQVEAKKDGTGDTPALVHSGDEGGAPERDAGEAPQGPGEDLHGNGNGGDGHVGGGAGGGDGPPEGGDGPPEGEQPNEDEEEEHKEVDPDLPETPAGEESSSEEDWKRQGYNADDIRQKRHQKQMRRQTAKSALETLDALQERMPEEEALHHMEDANAAAAKAREDAADEQRAQIQEELRRKEMAEKRAETRERILKAIAKNRAQEKKRELSPQELAQEHADLVLAEKLAAQEAMEAEAAEAAQAPEAPAAGLIEIKKEYEEEEVEPLQELQCLRWCHKCGTKNYLRQGLCVNMLCSLFYMQVPNAGQKLVAKGKLSEGASWSPAEFNKVLQNRVECSLLKENLQEELQNIEDLAGELAPERQKEPAPYVSDPITIEDLESGEKVEHVPEKIPEEKDRHLSDMSKQYQSALWTSAAKTKSKGLKRVLSLHAAIEKKKKAGKWIGPEEPLTDFGVSQEQKALLDKKVQKAIATAPWRRN